MTNLYVAEYFNKEVYERVEGGCSSNIFLGFVVATATERGFGASIWTLQSLILSRLVPTYRTGPLRLPSPFTSMKFLPAAIGFLVDRIIVGVALAFYYDKLTRTKHDS